jgi:hypothetical protein
MIPRRIPISDPVTESLHFTFAAHGYLLVDATYTPVNIPGPARVRDKAAAAQIQKDFPLLVAELHKQGQTGTKLLIVKSNVCKRSDKCGLPLDLFMCLRGGRGWMDLLSIDFQVRKRPVLHQRLL